MRAYLRFDPNWFRRKVVDQRYPTGAALAWISVFCLAEEQPRRGYFASERLLRLLLEEPREGVRTGLGKHIPYLKAKGDLVRQSDGELYFDGWREWQEGDVTVRERMARVRGRKGGRRDGDDHEDDTPPTVTNGTAPTVTTPSGGKPRAVGGKPRAVGDARGHFDEERDGLPHLPPDAQAAIVDAAGQLLVNVSDKVLTDLDGLVERNGLAEVCRTMAAVRAAGARRWPQLVYRTQDRLEPLSEERVSPGERRRREADELVRRLEVQR